MQEKKVSIVLPVYNGSQYLAESIESVINQTYTNWELIIINDCSTDRSLAIASSYASKDPRIKVYTNQINLKLPNSLNIGFEKASGEYYTWTSDDNKYTPNALRIMVETLDKNPNAVMVNANYTCIDSLGQQIEPINLPNIKYIFLGNPIGACFLYTANAAKKAGTYDSNLFLAEDYDYWIRLYKIGNIIHIEDNLYLYRRHENSLTETRKNQINEQTYKVLEKNFLFAYSRSIENGLVNEFFDHILNRAQDHRAETLNKLLLINKQYQRHLYWIKFWKFVIKNRLWKKFRKGK